MRQNNEKKNKQTYNKKKFLIVFCACMALFAIIRHVFSIDIPFREKEKKEAVNAKLANFPSSSSINQKDRESTELYPEEDITDLGEGSDVSDAIEEEFYSDIPTTTEGTNKRKNKVFGVHSFDKCFPDINDVQLEAARKNGITPVMTREEANMFVAQHKLVNISNSPFYTVDSLSHSMPYLVPKAQHLLNTICMNFIDSLKSKGLPPHLPMVTSVLRTNDDVSKLQTHNQNATTNSCHCYGTTVDISYNRFVPVTGHYDPTYPLTRWDFEMKCVLSEVLNDLRKEGQCYVKYEKKQGCFHLTVR